MVATIVILTTLNDCLVPRRRGERENTLRAGKQGARGLMVRRRSALACNSPTTPRALRSNKQRRLGTRQVEWRMMNSQGQQRSVSLQQLALTNLVPRVSIPGNEVEHFHAWVAWLFIFVIFFCFVPFALLIFINGWIFVVVINYSILQDEEKITKLEIECITIYNDDYINWIYFKIAVFLAEDE